jgi:parallel beta-helix repeat protein
MNNFAYTRIPVVILAVLALAACPKDKHHHDDPPPVVSAPPPSPTFFVNASTIGTNPGLDTNPGTQAAPFKTITHAMTVATTSGSTVQVQPGTYDVLNGETFPIAVPAGVLLIGDEPNKGGGTTPTKIDGSGPTPAGFDAASVAVIPGTGSTIAGFTINHDSSAGNGDALLLSNSTVTLRNNTVTGGSRIGIEFVASTNHVITGNQITSNAVGLGFHTGGVGTKVENNVITGNTFGVEYDVAGGDLGGGSAGSVGGNVLSCNTINDVVAAVQSPTPAITIFAEHNSWDHASPTLGCTSGDDVCDFGPFGTPFVPSTINTSPATQQLSNPSPCP